MIGDSVPRVSVLMPVYDGARYLREAVDSILTQTYADFEFIIVDDGSTDDTWAILNSYDDRCIRLVRNEKNIGLTRSLNKGLALARGEYVARMDGDDISLPERLIKQVNFLNVHPDIGALGCAVQVIDGDGTPSHVRRFPTEHAVLKWKLCFGDPIAHPTVMMRQDVVSRVGGYDVNMTHVEDYDLWRRLSSVTRLANLPEILLCLRRHSACITRTHRSQQLDSSIRVSQQMMTDVLSEDVPVRLVRSLWEREFEELGDVRQAARLIYRLCRASVADGTLSPDEKATVRRTAARRLFDLARHRAPHGRAWDVLGLALRLDPLVVGRAAAGRLRHLVRKQLLP